MGEVYLAEHQLLKRPCAIKLIRPEKAGNPTIFSGSTNWSPRRKATIRAS
jgi:serine/threonine protein kinase